MKFTAPKFAALFASSAAAFTPGNLNTATKKTSSLSASNWSPDPNAFCFGLPGAIAPFGGGFDPLGLSVGKSLEEIKYFREAETQHGRVAMLAVVGFLVQENPINFHPLFDAQGKTLGPAIYHLDEVRAVAPSFFTLLSTLIGFAELNRALSGWKAPQDGPWTLQEEYFPGDIGFDPLGLKPDDPDEFYNLSTKELQNGRLAMLAAMGFIAQELTNQQQIFAGLFEPELV